MKDENNKELERQEINPNMITEEYESYLETQIDEMNNRKTILEFRNQKKQLLFKKEFPSDDYHQ